jgi:hypothetical protein
MLILRYLQLHVAIAKLPETKENTKEMTAVEI